MYPPAFGAGGGHTRWVERGWGVNSSEDARHCSVLYICKYFVSSRDGSNSRDSSVNNSTKNSYRRINSISTAAETKGTLKTPATAET